MHFLVRGSAVMVLVSIVAVLSGVSAAQASVPWDNPSGSAAFFDWYGGQDSVGLFGSPTLIGGNAFRFTPSAFRAEAVDGASNTASDIAEWNVVPHAGYTLSQLRVIERGDYGITGAGPGNLARTENAVQVIDNMTQMQVNSSGNHEWTVGAGNWTLDSTLDLSPLYPGADLHIQIQNDLLAISGGAGNDVFVQKQLLGGIVDVILIPEPATVALAFLGLCFLRRRR